MSVKLVQTSVQTFFKIKHDSACWQAGINAVGCILSMFEMNEWGFYVMSVYVIVI